jgi:hypothetical protein
MRGVPLRDMVGDSAARDRAIGRGRPVGALEEDVMTDPVTQTGADPGGSDPSTRGLVPGLTSAEKAELTAAKKRIADLEAELAVSRRALELLKEEVSPKAVRGGGSDGSRTAACSARLPRTRNLVIGDEQDDHGADADGDGDGGEGEQVDRETLPYGLAADPAVGDVGVAFAAHLRPDHESEEEEGGDLERASASTPSSTQDETDQGEASSAGVGW